MISNNSIRKTMNSKDKIRLRFKNIICEKKISDKIFSLIDELQIKSICIYSPFSNEIKIDNLVSYLHEKNVKIYLPYMRRTGNDLVMEVREEGNTIFDDYHIKSSDGKKVDSESIDAYLIPGLAFNKAFYRIGYGKGFYDKLLANYQGIKIGACMNGCIIEEAFEEAHDIKMDYLVTEDRIIGEKHV